MAISKQSDAIAELVQHLQQQKMLTDSDLNRLKRAIAKKYALPKAPTNIDVLLALREKDLQLLEPLLLTKPVRTISGVSPIALMTKPSRCPHGKCTFCPGGLASPWGDVPQSYTGHEPATMRAMRNNYDPYLITFNRLEQYVLLGHTFDKIEFIIMGGTFPATPQDYQESFITGAFAALNDFSGHFFDSEGQFRFLEFKSFFELPGDIQDPIRTARVQKKVLSLRKQASLAHEQQRNETAHIRCVALCIETKPDWGFLEHGNDMLRLGCTRVELGVESVYDDVLAITHRGHSSKDTTKSIQILRDLGFKINFHYMPGLPLTDRERDIAGMKQLFDDPAYRPDMIKYYPCMVAPGTALYQQWKLGKFEPISTTEAAVRIVAAKAYTPEYCRIQRIQRDVPTKYWSAGVDLTNFRQFIQETYHPKCNCIRCREPRGRKVNWEKVEIQVSEYAASEGTEFFLSAVDSSQNILIGFCRLRFPSQCLRPEITAQSGLIRELHVYGTATAIGEEGLVQHRGFGRRLMARAEKLAVQHGKDKIVVISGIGVREYYLRLGYHRQGPYMVKRLDNSKGSIYRECEK